MNMTWNRPWPVARMRKHDGTEVITHLEKRLASIDLMKGRTAVPDLFEAR